MRREPSRREARLSAVRAALGRSSRTAAAWFAVGVLVGPSVSCRTPEAPRPVILVSVDTLRPDHLGCYGYRRPTSPNVDAFRRDAVLFRQAIAQAPSTLSSHASILTSLIPPHHTASIANNLALPAELVTLGEVLRDRGYATASFNGGMELDAAWGLDQGFDTYVSVKPRAATSESLVDSKDRFAYVAGLAETWIERNQGRPFFLFLHTYEVHAPYTPDAADLAPFRGGYAGRLADHITVEVLRRINEKKLAVDNRDRQHIVDAYDGEIRSMDRAFGGFVAFLKAKRLYDSSLIVLTSDHGEEFGEHGRAGWHAHSLFDELLRVPLLVKLPSARLAGTTLEAQARGIDVAPTILRALGVAPPAQFEGRDLLETDGASSVGGVDALSSRDVPEPNASVALRTGEWKLYDDRLYNLARDRNESEDVARRNADLVRRLHERRNALAAGGPSPQKRPATPDDELLERLRSLGYLE
jgi:arylsulfatase A-like enzyme